MAENVQNPLLRTQKLVAKTGAFRTWCGIDTGQSEQDQYDDAKARIHIHEAQSGVARPFCLIEWGEDRRYERRSAAGYLFNADAVVSFFNDFTEETAAAITTFDNNVAGIVEAMMALSGEGDLIEWDTLSWQGYTVLEVEQGTDVIVSAWNCQGAQWGVSDV